MECKKASSSLLDYYRSHTFNPVPISVENHETWNTHVVKRRNLYDRHLGIPLSLLKDRSVIEFGCNSGENALVLAMNGANLTLVEPNEQVLPRLNSLFKKFDLSERIIELRKEDINNFETDRCYDLVIAEGFLYALPNREQLIGKIAKMLVSGGISVISFNDRYGAWIEYVKRLVLWRACKIAAVDISGRESLKIALSLFGEDYSKLNASRPFDAWWKDTLVNPFLAVEYLWSFPELIPLIENEGLMMLSCSPKWSMTDHFNWYKNTLSIDALHSEILNDWRRNFSYILTGLAPVRFETNPVSNLTIDSVDRMMKSISVYTSDMAALNDINDISYYSEIDAYLTGLKDQRLSDLSKEIRVVFGALYRSGLENLIDSYRNSGTLRSLWGTAYHYLSFIKSL